MTKLYLRLPNNMMASKDIWAWKSEAHHIAVESIKLATSAASIVWGGRVATSKFASLLRCRGFWDISMLHHHVRIADPLSNPLTLFRSANSMATRQKNVSGRLVWGPIDTVHPTYYWLELGTTWVVLAPLPLSRIKAPERAASHLKPWVIKYACESVYVSQISCISNQ